MLALWGGVEAGGGFGGALLVQSLGLLLAMTLPSALRVPGGEEGDGEVGVEAEGEDEDGGVEGERDRRGAG